MHSVNHGTLLTSNSPESHLAFSPYACLAAATNGIRGCAGPLVNPSSPASAGTLAAVAAASSGFPYPTKDSRWLTLEVCRQFQRKLCSRSENECKFAHPPPQVDIQNGRVICCYDSIKGKCQRRDPPCKYFHPPQHLREQLLQNGRNNLIMKSMQFQLLQQQQHQFLAQSTMLPLTGSSVASSTLPNSPRQCAPSCSPVSSVASLSSTGNIIYPNPQQLNFSNHGITNAFSLLGINLAPYLNALAASSLNPLVSSAAMNVAQTVPVTFPNGSISPLNLGVISALPMPAPMAHKRVAMADNKSGMPTFPTDQTIGCSALNSLSISPNNSCSNNNHVFAICSPNLCVSSSRHPTDEVATTEGETVPNNLNSVPVSGLNSNDNLKQSAIYYPEHYTEIPQYGYP